MSEYYSARCREEARNELDRLYRGGLLHGGTRATRCVQYAALAVAQGTALATTPTQSGTYFSIGQDIIYIHVLGTDNPTYTVRFVPNSRYATVVRRYYNDHLRSTWNKTMIAMTTTTVTCSTITDAVEHARDMFVHTRNYRTYMRRAADRRYAGNIPVPYGRRFQKLRVHAASILEAMQEIPGVSIYDAFFDNEGRLRIVTDTGVIVNAYVIDGASCTSITISPTMREKEEFVGNISLSTTNPETIYNMCADACAIRLKYAHCTK